MYNVSVDFDTESREDTDGLCKDSMRELGNYVMATKCILPLS